MLIITENAAAAIRNLTGQPQAPAGTGLRITADHGDTHRLALEIQPAPDLADEVIETAGATLFLDPTAAAILQDRALDAHTDDNGAIEFTIETPMP